MIGTSIGVYRITAKLGAGGMGEVYRATDTKLKRDVALKVLPEAFARDPERLARFEREAEVLASLNHPNIAAIYGVVEDRALVMELVEGSEPKGPLPFDEAWAILLQVAAALEYAHEKGVVHRDLKPANIKVTPDGQVKLLDFGLAKAFSNQPDAAANPENSPTLTIGATQVGVILGTAAYMSPEQAKGKSVDKRADIWAFGVVLYELLTGERIFKGEDVSETLAQVLTKEPDLNKVPSRARKLLGRCLEKDPKKRLRDIGEAAYLLESADPAGGLQPSARNKRWVWPSIAAVFAVAAVVVSLLHFRETPPQQPRVQFDVALPGKASNTMFDISPDGRYLAVVEVNGTQSRLWVRPLDSGEARLLPGTEGASLPFFSPESDYIAFFADGKVKKVAVSGGRPQILCDALRGWGGAWGQNGVILFDGIGGLARVSSAGGVPTLVTKSVSQEDIHSLPRFLPDGRQFLFTVASDRPENVGIYTGWIQGRPPVHLLPDSSSAGYVAARDGRTGYLVFLHSGTLMAQPFDPNKAKLTGEMFPVVEQVGTSRVVGHADFSTSRNGTLVYRTGIGNRANNEPIWLDRRGKREAALTKPARMGSLAISPDEKRAAFSIGGANGGSDIWLLDISRGALSRFTFGPGVIDNPVWSPDGNRIAFFSRVSFRDLYVKPVTAGGQQQLLAHSAAVNGTVYDWSGDGKFLVYGADSEKTKRDLILLPLSGEHKPIPFMQAPYNESYGQFSPDGQWMAYASDESGQYQVYVRAMPQQGSASPAPVQISTSGGTQPRWRRDGQELFYISNDEKLMTVPVRISSNGIEPGAPQALFDFPLTRNRLAFEYQPAANGQHFLALLPAAEESPPPITVVLNWAAALKK